MKYRPSGQLKQVIPLPIFYEVQTAEYRELMYLQKNNEWFEIHRHTPHTMQHEHTGTPHTMQHEHTPHTMQHEHTPHTMQHENHTPHTMQHEHTFFVFCFLNI